MKRLIYAVGLFTVLACVNSYGQAFEHTIAQGNIPFDFHMGKVVMPAGKYVVSKSGPILWIRAKSGATTAVALTGPANYPGKPPNVSKMEFRHYGNDYFLSKIWTAGESEGLSLPKCKLETQLARAGGFSHTDEVAMNTK